MFPTILSPAWKHWLFICEEADPELMFLAIYHEEARPLKRRQGLRQLPQPTY
jgi:hypothetical protein